MNTPRERRQAAESACARTVAPAAESAPAGGMAFAEHRQAADAHFVRTVAGREALRARGIEKQVHPLWFGLGLSGIVGWSVALPTLAGVAAGMWIDRHYPSQYSWTLMLLIGGIMLGCLNAWYWIDRAGRRIRQD